MLKSAFKVAFNPVPTGNKLGVHDCLVIIDYIIQYIMPGYLLALIPEHIGKTLVDKSSVQVPIDDPYTLIRSLDEAAIFCLTLGQCPLTVLQFVKIAPQFLLRELPAASLETRISSFIAASSSFFLCRFSSGRLRSVMSSMFPL